MAFSIFQQLAILHPLNRRYADLPLTKQQRIWGRVVRLRKNLRRTRVGQRAKHAAYDLAFGKDVTLQTHGLDKYGRTLAEVLLPDATNVNHAPVKDGWCWWYRKYASGKCYCVTSMKN
jgi:endonuclease YncB( thermonuclease family)